MDRPIQGTAHVVSTKSGEITHWPKRSIFRVPEHIRYSEVSNFVPKLVSIGPYYHKNKNLKHMQDLKFQCIQEIGKISRETTNPPGSPHNVTNRVGLDPEPSQILPNPLGKRQTGINAECWKLMDPEFVQQLMVSGQKARDYYKVEFNRGHEEFVVMLFLDSCFIIRTILAFSKEIQSMSFLDAHIKDVRSDLLLLDNQIPLFFIKEVYEWFSNKDKKLPPFNDVLEPFICQDMPWKKNDHAKSSEAVHLLHLYWLYSLSPKIYKIYERYGSETERDLSNSNNALLVIEDATELQQMAGIEFEKFEDKGHLDVIFSNGIMRMPHLKIDSRQKILLRNLIAFEICCQPSLRIVSYYIKLMDALINSAKDVELLQKCGVIYNTLSSHKKAATFFNEIGDSYFTDDNANPFSDEYEKVKKYYNSPCNRRLASLRHYHFSTPWKIISVVAAVILLILSIFQTAYTISGYYHPKN